MNEEFITKGLENDRYLKAVRLYKQFEDEMFTILENVSKDVVEERPEWFVDHDEYDSNVTRRRTEPLGHMRFDRPMDRINSTEDRLTFQVCIEWTQPEVHRHDDHTAGALCIVFYKIKNLDRSDYEKVRDETKEDSRWDDIKHDDDIWNSDYGIFYIPVDSGPAVKEAFDTLTSHFLAFGDAYGELSSGANE